MNFYLVLFCEHYRDFKVALAVYYSVKTNSVKFYIDKYPKALPFCEITPSKSHGNYIGKSYLKIIKCMISMNSQVHCCLFFANHADSTNADRQQTSQHNMLNEYVIYCK